MILIIFIEQSSLSLRVVNLSFEDEHKFLLSRTCSFKQNPQRDENGRRTI